MRYILLSFAARVIFLSPTVTKLKSPIVLRAQKFAENLVVVARTRTVSHHVPGLIVLEIDCYAANSLEQRSNIVKYVAAR